MIWVGLDLHKKYITACALETAGAVVAEHRRLPADAEALVLWLTGLGGPVTVAMEATLYWAWLPDQLSVAGLPVVWVPSLEIRAHRKLLRGRAYLVRLRTSVKNRIHGHLTAENCRTEVTDLYGKAGRAWLATVELSEMGRIQIDLLLELVEQLDVRIKRLDRRVQQLVKGNAVAEQLQTWPGIGPFGAALLMAELGDIHRFRTSHECAAYAGLVPSTQSSGGKTTHGGVGRSGSP